MTVYERTSNNFTLPGIAAMAILACLIVPTWSLAHPDEKVNSITQSSADERVNTIDIEDKKPSTGEGEGKGEKVIASTTDKSSQSRDTETDILPVIRQPPATYEEARQISRNTPGYENLKKLGLAFHGYHDIFGRFPPAVLFGPDGKTPYSWRVELLPVLKHYVDRVDSHALQGAVTREQYNALIWECGYDITASWDSAANRDALRAMPDVYRHPSAAKSETASAYYALTGPGTAFDDDHVSTYTDIRGWVASTLMVAESRSREPWTKPIDIRYTPGAAVPRFGGYRNGGTLALTCDGCVHFLHDSTDSDQLRSLITRDQEDPLSIVGIPCRY